ncbi:MAG TPA: COX15/CtaA family protein [Flavobacteriales bacterium]|nr:COX15/CtaA family protein [Flavobacteriales bacterium]
MERKYAQIVRLTLVMLYLVILAGSVVRMSGSGMGCPDWPKCFGKWIPPTGVDQLPVDYQKIYSEKRAKKIERFARLLDFFGMDEQAKQLREDKSLLKEEEFNAKKTWTEYVNRLIGALAGLFVLIGVVYAVRFYKTNSTWFWLSLLNLILIVVTAWFGAIVVATNLMPWIITVHMMLAVILVMNQVSLITKVVRPRFRINVSRGFRFFLFLSVILTLTQIVFGTQVRQQVDVFSESMGEAYRSNWIYWVMNNGNMFFIHRSLSIALLVVTLLLMYVSGKNRYGTPLLNIVFLLMLVEVGLGMLLNYAGMPQFAQPLHLLVGTIIIGMQVYIYKRTDSR